MIVRHRQGVYSVDFGSAADYLSEPGENRFVVTDTNVESAWPDLVPPGVPKLVLPPGEPTKSLIWLERVASWLASQPAGRDSVLVALGGGVIGDLVGFAAATYMRGIPYVQVPTTLLAQVDSAVGGKVAVDIPEGKNLLGAFHPPMLALIDPALLSTLSLRQFRNGMAEVCKYGLIMDRDLARELQDSPLVPADVRLLRVIERCIDLKRSVVEADEMETNGLRAILNFGHTVGHALELSAGLGNLLHGEAISVGMVVEAVLGENLGISPPGTADVVRALLAANGLPIAGVGEAVSLIELIRRDKKARAGKLAFSLLTEIGGCKLVEGVEAGEVARALRDI